MYPAMTVLLSRPARLNQPAAVGNVHELVSMDSMPTKPDRHDDKENATFTNEADGARPGSVI